MPPPSPVRLLARQYANGTLERRDYVRERRRLIDAVTRGELSLPVDDAPTTANAGAPICTLSEMDATIELPRPGDTSAAASAARGTGVWWLVGSLAMALIGTATWLLKGLAGG
jgi:hypothetical protein